MAYKKKRTRPAKRKHPLYSRWANMNRRCYDPKDVCYKNYGERGITVCKEWRESFWNFAEWAMSAGYVEGLTLERIDVDKGYSPENCTFIPWRQQYHNRAAEILAYIGK